MTNTTHWKSRFWQILIVLEKDQFLTLMESHSNSLETNLFLVAYELTIHTR